jgi:hypothetical protein
MNRFPRPTRKRRTQYLYDIFTPDKCGEIKKRECKSSIYVKTCKWVSKGKYCRKRRNTKRL